jgi:CheY-like chemotaxis protein
MMQKILIIDDDRLNTTLIKFTLAQEGYEVILAGDGKEGLEQVEQENPNLIILDIQMPNMNGYEFMTELKSIQGFETTPVIMLTANENMEDVFKVEGVKGYFVKPVEPKALIEKVTEIIEESEV